MARRILIGLHDDGVVNVFIRCSRVAGYELDVAKNTAEFLDLAKKNEYKRAVMDINFGNPGQVDISPAQRAWEIFRPQAEQGLIKFVAISGNAETVEKALEEKIPADYTPISPSKFLND